MKLIEKKCPGCGAPLKFGQDDVSVTCEYCGKSLHIQRDEDKFAKLNEQNLGKAYQFVDEYGKPLVKSFAAVSTRIAAFSIVVFIGAFLIIVFTIFKIAKINDFNGKPLSEIYWDKTGENELEDNDKLVRKIEQIDSVSLQTFYDTSVTRLGNYNGSAVMSPYTDYSINDKWSKVGVYLLVSKDSIDNKLYTIMTQSYKNKTSKKITTVYAAVEFVDLELTDENIVNNDYIGIVKAPSFDIESGDNFSGVNGYTSVEKLYNQLIRSQSGTYTIEASEGLYIES